jgi:pimeloyl-ACP methyl ester carboxylesterase
MKLRMMAALVFGLLTLTACRPVVQATPVTPPAPLAWTPCSEPQLSQLECAQLQAPMDYAAPDGPTIMLGVARLQATDPAKRIGSLVFNPGGPGSAGSDILGIQAEYGAPFTARLREYFDLVALDPRGVGLSTPIKCDPEIWNEGGSLFPQDQAAYDAMVAHNKAFGESCLKNTGPALAYMDTVSVARDLDAIRAVLGEEKLNYFGLSYGTMVGAQYAELFPDKIRVTWRWTVRWITRSQKMPGTSSKSRPTNRSLSGLRVGAANPRTVRSMARMS